ncbi:MAG: ATP-dependent DNA helicase, partial [Lachnospiraceae bacterium]|nr:ATP-dependent DNA helicase [Lachnospiraceae bacterium]
MNLLRAQNALNFTNPERRMFGKVEGKVWDFFANTAPDEGYNFREGQYDMAEGVVKSIRLGEHLAVEAGVGIGKSFGYLVPLVLYHVEAGKPIVIATSTIALQEQLADDLESLLYMLDLDEPFIVAKGQSNYICNRRAMKYMDRWGDTKVAVQIARGLELNLADRKDFPQQLSDKEWSQVNIRNYKKKDCGLCEHAEQCYYYQMR